MQDFQYPYSSKKKYKIDFNFWKNPNQNNLQTGCIVTDPLFIPDVDVQLLATA